MDLLDMCLDFGTDSLRVDDLLLDPIASTPTPRPTLVTFPNDDLLDTFDDLDCDLDKLVADLRAEGVPTPVALDTPPVAPQPKKKKRKAPASAGRGTKRSKNSSVDTTSPDVRAGCSCSKRQCRTLYCVCFRAGRACDPEICVRCAGSCCRVLSTATRGQRHSDRHTARNRIGSAGHGGCGRGENAALAARWHARSL